MPGPALGARTPTQSRTTRASRTSRTSRRTVPSRAPIGLMGYSLPASTVDGAPVQRPGQGCGSPAPPGGMSPGAPVVTAGAGAGTIPGMAGGSGRSRAAEPADSARRDRREREGEHRWPAAAAVGVAIALYALLPESLLFAPRLLIPGLELALLVTLVA